ncbi:MAG TPA: hypothetical protein DCQ31_12510 [Bacteroidales bacterium]|nr:hypothetical protein [Bacteroidales bacterium]
MERVTRIVIKIPVLSMHSTERKSTILIVDDEYQHLAVISSIIENSSNDKYEILTCVDSSSAIEIARNKPIDVLITDWEMPKIDGIGLIKKFREIPEYLHMPIVMCTGKLMSSENLQHALEAGATDFIRKPIDEIELLARLNSMVQFAESVRNEMTKKEQLFVAEKKLLEIKLEASNKEKQFKDHLIISKALQIAKLSQLINDAKKEISDVVSECEYSNTCKVNQLKNNFASELGTNFWKEFEEHLNITHNDFFLKLTKSFPTLTKNEKRLCSLVFLNLSSKEISRITQQTTQTIDIGRYRLRQKLGLRREQNIADFLTETVYSN